MQFDRSLPIKERIKKRRLQKRVRIITVFSVLLLCIAGFIEWGIPCNSAREEVKATELQRPGTNPGTNPADFNVTGAKANYVPMGEDIVSKGNKTDPLKTDLENYIKNFKGQYGIYYMNLRDGECFGINDKDEYVAASTVKIPIGLLLFKMMEDGTANPDDTLTYLKEDYEEGTGEIRWTGKFGEKYRIRELAKLMVESSDNVATNMLLRYIGRQNVKEFMRKSGGRVVKDDANVSCPLDMAIYMNDVYRYCNGSELGKELMGYFENTKFNDRIPKLLPPNIPVAHKTGDQAQVACDVGIVFTEKPYVLSVMSKNIDEKQADFVIANISKKVYDFVVKNN
ncbi:MAG: class A beta-lactamase-related serine hydrolase [Clostridiales bacterium]|jgi:beta-lactamase class A|nr:class A beta-lactamase-related serine hydrolase [Eubacteriales bacterium]MDH7565457.1 class A beta-lactamase-related serine hydrolase [Clostridiales bacterium]